MIGTYNSSENIQVILSSEDSKIPLEGLHGKIIILGKDINTIKQLQLTLVKNFFPGEYHCRFHDDDSVKKLYLTETKFSEIKDTGIISIPYIDKFMNNSHNIEFLYAPRNLEAKRLIELSSRLL
ncbi:MAG: hypothetical protein ACP5NV_03615 [Candidatus Woesearchaeota archaeon]